MQPTIEQKLRSEPVTTILLVEDEAAVREITRDALLCAGYHVLESSGAEEAVQVATASDFKITLLLTDLVMRGMDGLALSKYLRSFNPTLMTILMSGYCPQDVAPKMVLDDRTLYLQKPFTLAGLCSQVASAGAAGQGRSKPNFAMEVELTGSTASSVLEFRPPLPERNLSQVRSAGPGDPRVGSLDVL